MAGKVRLNSRGIEAAMKSREMSRAITELAEQIAANVESQGIRVDGVPGEIPLPVEVSSYTTDRARSSVTLAHPSGLAVQAKHGALSKAAAAVGLEVSGE